VYWNGAVEEGDGVVEVVEVEDDDEEECECEWACEEEEGDDQLVGTLQSGRTASSSNLNPLPLAFNLCTNRHKNTPTSA
jgi:hypothetical protein